MPGEAQPSETLVVNDSEIGMHAPTVDPLNVIAAQSRSAAAVARQAPRRMVEERLRQRAADLCDDLASHGRPVCHVARQLRLSRRTLNRWRGPRRKRPSVLPRGRPCKESSCTERRAVLELLVREGAHLGLPAIRAEFASMPRGELGELQAAYRRHYRATHRRSVERLTWREPGHVWAMDHVVPPYPIDGVNRAVLAVRDLASGQQLAWRPVLDQTAPPTADVLKSLIAAHGPPLLVKSDNGSAFKGETVRGVLDEYGIVWLPSPPRTPWYNGGCEAGNRSMRIRTEHFAERAGGWTGACLEAARRQGNELTRPLGHRGPTHSQQWAGRTPIEPAQRQQFRDTLARHEQDVLAERRDDIVPGNKNHQHQVLRQAARRALLELGLLTITKRSISLPIKRKKRAKIS